MIEPLDLRQQLAVRHTLTETLLAAQWELDGWASADRQAGDLIDRLRRDGYELMAVTWR